MHARLCHPINRGPAGFAVKLLRLYGERGGTRTLDPMIKSHVLYRLSYALTYAGSCSARAV